MAERLINPRGSRYIHVPDARVITAVTVDDVITTDYDVLLRDGAPVRIELRRRGWIVKVTGTFAYATREEITPAVADLAQLLHARTTSGGGEIGTFNDTTSPTGVQALRAIELGVDEVLSRVDAELPFAYVRDAKRLAALQAACLVETSFLPNEVDGDRTAYRQYSAMFLSGLATLITNARRAAYGGLG
ncbi:MAG: hypothetical protein WKF48_05720 [Solirubrobacteraceae bacterium]